MDVVVGATAVAVAVAVVVVVVVVIVGGGSATIVADGSGSEGGALLAMAREMTTSLYQAGKSAVGNRGRSDETVVGRRPWSNKILSDFIFI